MSYSPLHYFFHQLLKGCPIQELGKVTLYSNGSKTDLQFIMQGDPSLLNLIKKQILEHSGMNLTVWHNQIDIPRRYVDSICQSLKLICEVSDLQDQLSQAGAEMNQPSGSISKKYLMDLGELSIYLPNQKDKLAAFKKAYKKQYESEWFSNPWSKMKMQIEAGRLGSIEQVIKYAHNNPSSRTAKVLAHFDFSDKSMSDASSENDMGFKP